tara:strand:+ start:327 stop:557 length:231 start_codon:yes stop_codon:yes gene_type:complete
MGAATVLGKKFFKSNVIQAAQKSSPSKPEVSQATATSMDGYDARRTKARGRSNTILTSAKGVEDQSLTLGKVSLLG